MKNTVTLLRCPICRESIEITQDGRSLKCKSGHCFDFSSSGYVNLTHGRGSAASGDSKEMIRARRDFLAAGYYSRIAESLSDILLSHSPRSVIDAGCGEGYYTSFVAGKLTEAQVIGFDLSKSGIDIAAKSAKRNGLDERLLYSVAGIFDLPIKDECADAVINLFAPCAHEEFHRVLTENGILITVVAGVRHLYGLKQALYDVPYENELRRDILPGFDLENVVNVSYETEIKKEHIFPLFTMTPYYFRTSPEDSAKLDRLDSLKTEVSADILIYRKA